MLSGIKGPFGIHFSYRGKATTNLMDRNDYLFVFTLSDEVERGRGNQKGIFVQTNKEAHTNISVLYLRIDDQEGFNSVVGQIRIS